MKDYLCVTLCFSFKEAALEFEKGVCMSVCLFAHMSTFLIYPYKHKYMVNRAPPLLENTQSALVLGVNTK